MVAIAEALVEPIEPRSFDETLFVVCFAAAYGDLLARRLEGTSARSPPGETKRAEARRRVTTLLDPERALRVGRRSLTVLLADLEERVRSSVAMEEHARAAGPKGDRDAARLLERLGGYQLQRVRPLGELLLALPEDVRAFELSRGLRLRAELLFGPLAEAVRAQRAILDALGAKVRAL